MQLLTTMTVRALPRPRTFDDMVDRLERVEANVGGLIGVVKGLAENVGGLIADTGRLPSPVPMRGPDDTLHDFDPKLPRLRAALREAVKDPRVPFGERDGARELDAFIERIEARRELNTWRTIKRWIVRIGWKGALWLSAGGGAAELVRWWVTHR